MWVGVGVRVGVGVGVRVRRTSSGIIACEPKVKTRLAAAESVEAAVCPP